MLKANNDKGARDALDRATGLITNLDRLIPTENGRKAAANILLETIKTSGRGSLKALSSAAPPDVIAGFAKHVEFTWAVVNDTFAGLQRFETDIRDVSNAIASASEGIRKLQGGETSARQVTFIRDILSAQQSPAIKLYKLEQQAAKTLTVEQRAQLGEYFKAEQRKQQFIATTGNALNVAKQLQTIAARVGFSDPNVAKALDYASVAQTAISQAATGNYIGAALAVTGLFGGGKPDPEQQRFAQLMGFLQEMDKKLNQIIDLQIKTLEAIQGLSNQLADLDRRLNERLDRIAWEVKLISQNLKDLTWSKYQSCNTAWFDRSSGEAKFDDNTLQFRSAKDLRRYVEERRAKAIECANLLDDLFQSIKTDQVFGQLLSLTKASKTDFNLLPSEMNEALATADLELFLKEIHRPAETIFLMNWQPEWGAIANGIALLSSPSGTTHELKARLQALHSISSGKLLRGCSNPTLLSWRMRSTLCVDARYASQNVTDVYSDEFGRACEQEITKFPDRPNHSRSAAVFGQLDRPFGSSFRLLDRRR